MEEGTRVICRTLLRRGRSCTPASRIEMLELSRATLDWREVTQLASWEADMVGLGAKVSLWPWPVVPNGGPLCA